MTSYVNYEGLTHFRGDPYVYDRTVDTELGPMHVFKHPVTGWEIEQAPETVFDTENPDKVWSPIK